MTAETPARGGEPMQYASCYSLDLYCDRLPDDPMDDRIHGWNEFPHQFTGETFAECARAARKRGWKIHRKTRTATCPKCGHGTGRAAQGEGEEG